MSLFTFLSKKKKKEKGEGWGWDKTLNSLAIKLCLQETQASEDGSATHPSISTRLRVCVSTMHVLPWARFPMSAWPWWALCEWVPGLTCPLVALVPSPQPMPIKDSILLLPAGKSEASIIPESYALVNP